MRRVAQLYVTAIKVLRFININNCIIRPKVSQFIEQISQLDLQTQQGQKANMAVRLLSLLSAVV